MPLYFVGVLVMALGLIVYVLIDRRPNDIPLIIGGAGLVMAALGQITKVDEGDTRDSDRVCPSETFTTLLEQAICEAREIRDVLKENIHPATGTRNPPKTTKARNLVFVAGCITALAILLRRRR